MTAYTYSDNYLVNSVDATELEAAETDALLDLSNQGVTQAYYLEKMTLSLVYIELAGRQLESEVMKDKADFYRKEYLRYSQMDKIYDEDAEIDAADEGVYSGSIGRA